MSSTTSATTATSTGTGKGTFTLLLFASASTYASGLETLHLPAPTTLRGIMATLESRFPGMRDKVLRSAAVTVNLEYVDFDLEAESEASRGDGQGGGGGGLDMVINEGDEVGVIPPVSSG
ncbi:uncharacterized protein Z520_02468 [Fonsecaea multimorphosa CBS 102226]|uniref:MOCS2A n=1 Tax=Fonsecaea multimorphosa CBS 102226 TaxID=1442371 RepID=A0A0D2KFU4_9EURO|nr:uncharacterized protein Z520_02468 [Fonsecaea multimorphosa CBS 102226]KIY02330.1 hypothetical protein Z520_02468 [Fonsecaea multimorphosa CBS 102226]OAL28974.1 hypothetical protein AYO22_02410 [Fonsecaea multimorphosa]